MPPIGCAGGYFFRVVFSLIKSIRTRLCRPIGCAGGYFFTYKIAAKRRFAGGQRNKNAKNSDELSPVRKKDNF